MEPNKDFIHIRDGSDPSDPLLAKMTGGVEDNPKFILSSTNRVYIYFHSSFGDSRRGFAIRFRAGTFILMPFYYIKLKTIKFWVNYWHLIFIYACMLLKSLSKWIFIV